MVGPSHPAVEARRQSFRARHDKVNQFPRDAASLGKHEAFRLSEKRNLAIHEEDNRVEQAVEDALRAIEPQLANGEFDAIPPELKSKAYLDGVDIWSPGAHYTGSEESRMRTINDNTLPSELIELRQQYLDRALCAADQKEAQEMRDSYFADALTLLTGSAHQGLRSLGNPFDQRMLDARAKYKTSLVINRRIRDGGSAYKRYADTLCEIITDYFIALDKAEKEVADRVTHVVDRVKVAAPVTNDVTADPPRRTVQVVTDEHVEPVDPDEFVKALSLGHQNGLDLHPHVVKVQDVYARHDRELSERWRNP